MQAFPTMRDLLDSARLGQYVRPFMEQGFDDVEFLVHTLSRSESKMEILVQQTGLKPGHLLKLQTALTNLREARVVSPDALLLPTPHSPAPASSLTLRVPVPTVSGPPPHLSPSHMFGERTQTDSTSTSSTSPRPSLHPSTFQFPSAVAPPRPHTSSLPARCSSPLNMLNHSEEFAAKPLEPRKPREAHARSRSTDHQHTPDSLYEAMNPFSAALQLDLLPPATHSRPNSRSGTPVPGSPSLMPSSSASPCALSLSSPAQTIMSPSPAPINEGDQEEEQGEEQEDEEEEEEDEDGEEGDDEEEIRQQQNFRKQHQQQQRQQDSSQPRFLNLPSPVKASHHTTPTTPPSMKSPSPSPSLGKLGYQRPLPTERTGPPRYQLTFEDLDQIYTDMQQQLEYKILSEEEHHQNIERFAPNPRALPFDPSKMGGGNPNKNFLPPLFPPHIYPPLPPNFASRPFNRNPHKASPYMLAAGMNSSNGPAPVLPYSSPHYPPPLPPVRHSFSYQRPQFNLHQSSHPFQTRPGQYLVPQERETTIVVSRAPTPDIEETATKKKKKKKMTGGVKQCTNGYFCKERLDCKLVHYKDELAFFRNPQTKTRLCQRDLGSVCDKTAETCPFAHGVADARCSKCHRRGHLAVDCPETKTKVCRKKNGQICDQDPGDCSFAHSSEDARCSACKQRGHFASECPSPPVIELSKTQLKKKLRAQKQAEVKKKADAEKTTKDPVVSDSKLGSDVGTATARDKNDDAPIAMHVATNGATAHA